MADYIPDIAMLLPQGPPFILVDKLLFSDETTSRTSFRITAESPLVDNGHFGEGGLLENIAQTAAAGSGYQALQTGGAVAAGYIISVSNFIITALPGVGDELRTETRVQMRIPDIIVISGVVTCKERVIATCEMKILTSV
jgi:predicted hotdog family 3-hydroxylacyl-ACP dehydratase